MIQAKKTPSLPTISYETPREVVECLLRQERLVQILLREEPQPLELVPKEPKTSKDWRHLCEWFKNRD